MISNSDVTIYHKSIDVATRLEQWTRYNYSNIWFFGSKGASVNKGFSNTNAVEIRIPITGNVNIDHFSLGDIIVQGSLDTDITKQQDLNAFQTYNITNIKNNNFGSTPHIHISGE